MVDKLSKGVEELFVLTQPFSLSMINGDPHWVEIGEKLGALRPRRLQVSSVYFSKEALSPGKKSAIRRGFQESCRNCGGCQTRKRSKKRSPALKQGVANLSRGPDLNRRGRSHMISSHTH